MLVVRYEAQRSSAKPHSAEFILGLPKGFVRDYEPNPTGRRTAGSPMMT